MQQELIEKLMQEKKVLAIDHLAAESLDPDRGRLFVMLLFLAVAYRQGHLFLDTKPQLQPSVESIWGHEYNHLHNDIVAGFEEAVDKSPLVKQGSRIYFEKAYTDIEEVRSHLHRLLQNPVRMMHCEKMRLHLLHAQSNSWLTKEQGLALTYLIDKPIGGVIGGPGTGKTYAAGQFLKAYLGVFPEVEQRRKRIVLTGPTGKAVQNLKKSIERAYGETFSSVEELIEVKTLHALLKIYSFQTDEMDARPLPYHLIIVDEASMIDISLMRKLLAKIKKGTQIFFLGDPNQLQPVEPGAIFPELIRQQSIPFVTLKTCLRCELQPIIEFAQAVLQGNIENIYENWRDVSNSAVSSYPLVPESFSAKQFIRFFPEIVSGHLDDINAFRLLCPVNEGSFSISSINKELYKECRSLNREYVPIIVTKNDYELNLMNGQMGLLSLHKNMAKFMIERQIFEIPLSLLPRYDLAFCLSVHKSQGSEFDHVVLFLPPGSEHFGQKMLYTAITRAKKKIEIYGEPAALVQPT